MTELHTELAFTLRCRSEITTEAEHAIQTAIGPTCEIFNTDFTVVDDGISFL